MNAKHNILKLVEESNRKIKELREEVRKGGVTALREVAAEIFASHQGLRKFVVWGYTPSFNDGEPCTHTGIYGFGALRIYETYTKGKYTLGGDDAYEVFDEFLEVDDMNHLGYGNFPKDFKAVYVNSGVSEDQFDAIYSDLSQISDVIEILFETNYQVLFTLNDDGTVTVEDDEYDCGY